MMMEWTIRLATERDAPAMARLLGPRHIAELSAMPLGPHYLLVAEDDDGQLAALAVVQLVAHQAELRMLVMAPAYDDEHLARVLIEAAAVLALACEGEAFDPAAELDCN